MPARWTGIETAGRAKDDGPLVRQILAVVVPSPPEIGPSTRGSSRAAPCFGALPPPAPLILRYHLEDRIW